MNKKRCELCLKEFEPDRHVQKLCQECLGIAPYPLSEVPDPPPTESFIVNCQNCGVEFDPYRNGKAMQKKFCRPCMTSKRKKTFRSNAIRREPNYLGKHCVVLEFTRFPWALAWLKAQNEQFDMSIEEALLLEIASKVPAEWLKDHLLNGVEMGDG
jgi:hypothetical protein